MASSKVPEQATSAEDDSSSTLDFLTLLQNLKTTPRTGWVYRGVKNPESIADHMYRMSIMAMVAAGDEGLDAAKCMQMALAHDMAEAVVGDITPHDGVSDEDKHARELGAMTKMTGMLGSRAAAARLLDLWKEYEAGASPEALLLKDMDKLEMILQAQEYETAQGLPLEEFYSCVPKLKSETAKKWAAGILKRRPAGQGDAPLPDSAAKRRKMED